MSTANPPLSTPADREQSLERAFDRIRKALDDLRFGSVAVTVHNGRVVQIDITEKERFTPS